MAGGKRVEYRAPAPGDGYPMMHRKTSVAALFAGNSRGSGCIVGTPTARPYSAA